MKTFAGFAFLLLLSVPASAQVPYIESLEVRVHGVDVVVTDAKGNPVAGLTADDFQLLEDGVEKPITNFSAFHADAPAPKEGGTPATAPTPEKRAPRKFIFYVDEMSLSQPTQRKLEAQLNKLIDGTMEAGDEAMVLRPAQEKKLAAPFSDRETARKTLLEAIRAERWRGDAPILRELRLLENEMRGVRTHVAMRVAARRWAGLVRARAQQRFGQLHALVNAASEVEGRKVLVLIAESLPLEPGKEAFTAFSDLVSVYATNSGAADGLADWTNTSTYQGELDWVNLRPLVDQIARSAATNGITIYSLQPEYGLSLLGPGGNIGATTPGRDLNPEDARMPASASRLRGTGMIVFVEHMSTNTESAMRPLAEMTGGTWQRGGLSIDETISAITADVRNYYSLGYRAGEARDRAHRLEVRVKGRPELRVRTRHEVIRKSAEQEMTDRVVSTLLVPTTTNELGITVETEQTGVAPDRQYKTMHVNVRVPLSALTFVPDGDKLKASFSVHYAVAGRDTDFVSGVHGEQVVEVPATQFERAKAENWVYVLPINLRPARHVVAVGVLDSISNLSGFARVELDLR